MEIIETIPKYCPYPWVMGLVCLLVISAFAVGGIVHVTDWEPIPVIINIIIIAAAVVLFILTVTGAFNYVHHNEYAVKFNDDVSIHEIYDKYDIIKKEKYSDVYIVKLKDGT